MVSHLKTMTTEQILARYRKTDAQLPIALRWLRLNAMSEIFGLEKPLMKNVDGDDDDSVD